MKRALVLTIVLLIVGVTVAFLFYFPHVDVGFAAKGYVRFHAYGKHIDARVSAADLAAMKRMFVGRSYADTPSCGFDTDVSISLTDGCRTIVLCPALDTDATLRIGTSDRYIAISKEERKQLDAILAKYGVVFNGF